MGPKKAEPEPVAARNGANVCYIQIKLVKEAEFISITLNSNTRVDILLDTVKTLLLQDISKRLSTPQPQALPPPPVAEPVEGEEAPKEAEAPEDPVAEWQAMINRLNEIQETLTGTVVQELELQQVEGEKVMEIQGKLTDNGKELLPHSSKFSLGRMVEGEFKAF